MNTTTTTQEIVLTAEIIKNIKKNSCYSQESFISDAYAYIDAIRDNRMINVIGSVSSSGMSRTIKFTSCEKAKDGYYKPFYQRNYFSLFQALGYTPVKNSSYFRITGCGMDMIFATNYEIIHRLHRIGLIDKTECDQLAQQTPTTI